MSRLPTLGALLLAVSLVTGCRDDSTASSRPAATSPTAAATTPETVRLSVPAQRDRAPPDADDPALDPALSGLSRTRSPRHRRASVDAPRFDLDLASTPDTRTLVGEATIELPLDRAPAITSSSTSANRSTSGAVTLDAAVVTYQHHGKNLVVSAPVTKDERYVLEVGYAGTPEPTPAPDERSDFSTSGWTITPGGETWTMQEPYGAFTWYPVNDQPSDKAFYDISVTVPSPWVGIANGVMTDQTEHDGLTTTAGTCPSRRRRTSSRSPPATTRAPPTPPRAASRSPTGCPAAGPGLATGLESAAAGLDWLEGLLGPYPFDSLGFLLVDSRSGMETQTMITLGATDYTTSTAVLVHEMAHQWYGDQVTPDDWRDVWMNEGMAMYLQGCWQAEADGRSVDAVMDDYASFEDNLRAKAGPPAAYDPAQFGEGNIYYGPALMWHELRKRIGDDAFWDVVRHGRPVTPRPTRPGASTSTGWSPRPTSTGPSSRTGCSARPRLRGPEPSRRSAAG